MYKHVWKWSINVYTCTKMYKICRWSDSCPSYIDTSINDNGMYVGRIQVNLNDGRKRKFLYFQADYNTRKWKKKI